MRAIAAVMFAAILTPLGARLAMPYIVDDLPDFADPAVRLLIWWTDRLALPFTGFDLPGFLRATTGPAFGVGPLEPQIVVALIAWSIIQAIVMTVLALFRRRGRPDTVAQEDEP